MRIVDFKKLEVKTEIEYKVIDFTFELKEILDIPFLQFAKELSQDMKDKIEAANLSQYKDDALVFQFKTDLTSRDLDDMIPQLVSTFVLNLGITKTEFKHGEKRLNVPPSLDTLKPAYITPGNLLDLVNYNLPVERFNMLFFNGKDKAITSIVG